MPHLTSAKGLIMLLSETDLDIVQFALTRISGIVDEFWYEISSQLNLIEELHEGADLPEPARKQAALVASKVYFHLGEYEDSIHYALAAADLFNPKDRSLYTDTLLGKCIDRYMAHRADANPEKAPLDDRLEALFCALAASWEAEDGGFVNLKELIGLMISVRRLDLLEGLLKKHVDATGNSNMLTFCLNIVNVHVHDIEFRRKVITVLSTLFTSSLKNTDYFALAQCYLFLNDATQIAQMVVDLLAKNDLLVAYQVGFDLFEHGNQELLHNIAAAIKKLSGDDKVSPNGAMVLQIMDGTVTTSLYVKFLYSQCKADIHVLNRVKKALDPRNSVTQVATFISNALMYSGTTLDGFLRDNLEWVGKAKHWASFTATASVGCIHRGHTEGSMALLKPYLPDGPVGALPFSEAGSLYALGLVHAPVGADVDSEVMTFLRGGLRTYAANETMIHGAALGIGLVGMGLHNEEIFDSLFACVSGCDAVAGEAAAIGIGLLMMGSGKMDQIQMILQHAKEDQKEKTIRGLSMAIALMLMSKEGDADAIIDDMFASQDPWVRVGGAYTLGLAYAGTGNAKAVERLLSVAVKDTSDEVRRTAVAQIGFITFMDPKFCVAMTKILSDSYNPHIRYGVAMAIAVAASGTGNKDAINVLKVLMADTVDFVRQGAIVGLAMVMMQLTEKENEFVKEFRETVLKKIEDRKEDTCTKFGCIMAAGILDAGGRSCTIALHKQRHPLKKAIAGVFLFTQHWYWFPLTLMLSLALTPTCVIGLNQAMLMPKYQFNSAAPPSRFAPPKSVYVDKKAKEITTKRAVLSTTAKVSEYRQKRKDRKEGDSKPGSPTTEAAKEKEMAEAVEKAAAEKEEKDKAEGEKEEEEATSELLLNPARVTMSQLSVLSHNVDARYKPLKADQPYGVVMLTDSTPEEAVEEVNLDREDQDVKPPEPFTWP